ncbi:hypothetical protein GALL_130120 [mine drainage metagenome]|uniref:DUF4124 domain-containing protein n=1 Tax=mine drainage metagenome TaxID=410659 RepID=A0A1J5S9R4_9ZZZZ
MKPLLSMSIEIPRPKAVKKLSKLCVQGACLSSTLLLLVFTLPSHAQGTGKILKWKDEKGTTHYGDRIPPQYSNRESSTINPQGIIIKHNVPISTQDQAVDIAKLDQNRKDKALLDAFTNENEIDLARDRNLQSDLVTLENLQLDKSNIQKHLAENQKLVDSLTKQKKKIPADLSTEMANNQVNNAKLEQLIKERKLTIENTRQRFDHDKQRYIALKYHTTNNDATAAEMPTPVSSTEKNPTKE